MRKEGGTIYLHQSHADAGAGVVYLLSPHAEINAGYHFTHFFQRSRTVPGRAPDGRIRHSIGIAAEPALPHPAVMPRLRPVWILIFPDVQVLDVTGPLEVRCRPTRPVVLAGVSRAT